MPPNDSTNEQTGEHRTIASDDGLTLHYAAYGSGSGVPVICLHGLSRNARDFEGLARHLESTRTVYCADFRGRGRSEWDSNPTNYAAPIYVKDIEKLIGDLRLDKVILVGTSLGGIVSTGLCHALGKKVAGVVLNDIGPVIEQDGLARIGTYVGSGVQWASWTDAVRDIREVNKVVYPDFTDDEWLGFVQQTCRENADGRIVQDYDPAIAQGFAQDQAASVELWPVFDVLTDFPVLIIRGALSDLLSEATVAAMVERYPQSHAVTIPNRGHVPTLMEADALTAIERFIARVDGQVNAQESSSV